MNGGGMFSSMFRREVSKNGAKAARGVTSENPQQATLSSVTPKSQNGAVATKISDKKSLFRTTAPGAWVSDWLLRIDAGFYARALCSFWTGAHKQYIVLLSFTIKPSDAGAISRLSTLRTILAKNGL
jgi:hypothetical protein